MKLRKQFKQLSLQQLHSDTGSNTSSHGYYYFKNFYIYLVINVINVYIFIYTLHICLLIKYISNKLSEHIFYKIYIIIGATSVHPSVCVSQNSAMQGSTNKICKKTKKPGKWKSIWGKKYHPYKI